MILLKRSVILILISTLFSNMIGMAVYSYVPRYLFYLGINIAFIQLIVTIFPFTAFVFPPILGKYSDKYQSRFIFFFISAIGFLISFFLLMIVIDLILIILLLFLWGFSSACSQIIFVLYQEYILNDEIWISYYNATVVLGWFLGAFTGGIFIELIGINFIFNLLLVYSIINFIIIIFIKENRNLIKQNYKIPNLDKISENSEKNAPVSKSIYGGLFFRNFGIRPIISILAIIIAFHLSSDSQIGFLIGINPLIQFFLMLIIGRIIKDKNIKTIMIIGYLLSVFVIFGYIFSTDFLGFLVSQILVSFSFAMFWTATQVYIARNTTPENKGKYMGYANSSFYLGSFIGGLYLSLLIYFFNNYYLAFWFMIIWPGISALIILFGFNIEENIQENFVIT